MIIIYTLLTIYCLGKNIEMVCVVREQKCSEGVIIRTLNITQFSKGENIIRSVVIGVIMLYFFLGLSVICDKFMAAIEVITSTVKEVKSKSRSGDIIITKERVWNETVSNLTLMALGSSAPEIMLAVIETCGKNFQSGDLGPGTIVGSAAFNLFVICGICILVIPKKETRSIEHLSVFLFTASSSMFAYIWAYLVSSVISEAEIQIWEALITLLLFPITVVIAYFFDIQICCHNNIDKQHSVVRNQINYTQKYYLGSDNCTENEEIRNVYIEMFKEIRKKYESTSIKVLEDIARYKIHGKSTHSRAFYKMEATKSLTGNNRVWNSSFKNIKIPITEIKSTYQVKRDLQIIQFHPQTYIVKEDIGTVNIRLERVGGDMDSSVKLSFKTLNGTALADSDFIYKSGIIHFRPFQTSAFISIDIINDDLYEDDEYFTVALSDLKFKKQDNFDFKCVLKEPAVATIFIIDDDHPGIFGFVTPNIKIAENLGSVVVSVNRMHGARGVVHLPFKTIDGTALGNGRDYTDLNGVLIFENNEITQNIVIQIIDREEYEKEHYFYVKLNKPFYSSGDFPTNNTNEIKPQLGNNDTIKVVIVENSEFKNVIDRLINQPITNEVEKSNWKTLFHEAFSPILTPSEENMNVYEELPPMSDIIIHFITLFWKVLFALVPPTEYLGGWLTFSISIIYIGILTAVVGDLAALFGCHVGLLDEITSMTFVALGTSLPDTFASKVAAINEASADSSIGNVTGSNAVNVYLGLGAAWAVASIVNKFRNKKFTVTMNIDFSVILYIILSFFGILILLLRRHPYIGGELGGPTKLKYLSAFLLFLLYFIFVVIVSLRAYCII